MRSFFSKAELSDLVALKNQLAVTPATYFFIYVDTLDTLKEIATPMLSLQWHFLRKGLSDIVNCFGYLGQLSKAMVSNDSSKIDKAFNNVLYSSLSAMASIGLDLGLCYLHTVRLFTLVISNLLLGSLRMILAIPGVFTDESECKRAKVSKEIDFNISKLKHGMAEVNIERKLLSDKIKKYMTAKAGIFSLLQKDNEKKITLNNPKNTTRFNQQLLRLSQIFRVLIDNLNSYPDLKLSEVCLDYTHIERFLTIYEEHHNLTMELAGIFFKDNDIAEFLLWKHGSIIEQDSGENGFKP